MKRDECLSKAELCVCGQRQNDYGTPEDSFNAIAALWSAYYGAPFDAVDVAMMMALLKIARIRTGTGTDDSFVDLAGYAACGCEIQSGRAGVKNEHFRLDSNIGCSRVSDAVCVFAGKDCVNREQARGKDDEGGQG